MQTHELLRNPEFPTLDRSQRPWVADLEIQLPSGLSYCISWTYVGQGAIDDPRNYDLLEIMRFRSDEDNHGSPIKLSQLDRGLAEVGFDVGVLEQLLATKLERYGADENPNGEYPII